MKKVTLLLATLLAANMAIADGHGHGHGHGHDNEFPFKYFLHNDLTTENAQATLAGTRAFVETGVMSDRGVAVGLYAYSAAGAHAASHMTMFAYPSADALPGPDLFQGSDAHIQYQSAMRGAGN